MIVREVGESIELVTQPDHAHLAGRFMEHCEPLRDHPRRAPVLLGIAEHDNGWAEEDAAPRVNPATGGVMDFVHAPLAIRHAVWPRGVARVAHDPWVAALVAQHALTVYDRYYQDAAWTFFFEKMAVERDRYLAASGRPLAMLLDDYRFVRLADLISLAFCTGWTGEHGFRGWTVRLHGSHVVVDPDPFEGRAIPLRIGARRLNRSTFGSDAELREALEGAETITIEGMLGGADGS